MIKTRPKQNILIRQIKARPRLFISFILGLLILTILPDWLIQNNIVRFLIAWDSGIIFYLILASIMITRSTKEKMKTRAKLEDEGQFVILFFVVIAAIISLISIIAEMTIIRGLHDFIKYYHLLLAVLTIIASWFFTHMMFALHYAHYYYANVAKGNQGGLDFPGKYTPEYSDFIYFAYIIGTSGQTADVNFSSKSLRKVGTLHCILSFFFNTTIIALTINIISGLF